MKRFDTLIDKLQKQKHHHYSEMNNHTNDILHHSSMTSPKEMPVLNNQSWRSMICILLSYLPSSPPPKSSFFRHSSLKSHQFCNYQKSTKRKTIKRKTKYFIPRRRHELLISSIIPMLLLIIPTMPLITNAYHFGTLPSKMTTVNSYDTNKDRIQRECFRNSECTALYAMTTKTDQDTDLETTEIPINGENSKHASSSSADLIKNGVIVINGDSAHGHTVSHMKNGKSSVHDFNSLSEKHINGSQQPPSLTTRKNGKIQPINGESIHHNNIYENDVTTDSIKSVQVNGNSHTTETENSSDVTTDYINSIQVNGNSHTTIIDNDQQQKQEEEEEVEIPSPPLSSTKDNTSTASSKTSSSPMVTSTKLRLRNLWKRRHAKSLEEGIRREDEDRGKELLLILQRASSISSDTMSSSSSTSSTSNKWSSNSTASFLASRTLTGLISALATERSKDLDVRVLSRDDTPLWSKQVDELRVEFGSLQVEPLRMGGNFQMLEKEEEKNKKMNIKQRSSKRRMGMRRRGSTIEEEVPSTTDTLSSVMPPPPIDNTTSTTTTLTDSTTFDQIDTDNSGSLDEDEIARALIESGVVPRLMEERSGLMRREEDERYFQINGFDICRNATTTAAPTNEDKKDKEVNGNIESTMNYDAVLYNTNIKSLSRGLASQLLDLYDINNDGVVDRSEYDMLVKDMNVLKEKQRQKNNKRMKRKREILNRMKWRKRRNFLNWCKDRFINNNKQNKVNENGSSRDEKMKEMEEEDDYDDDEGVFFPTVGNTMATRDNEEEDGDDGTFKEPKCSFVFKNLKLDVRRLFFGAIPIVKHITPGGPLVLEPFTATMSASFNKEDMMNSPIFLEALRRLVRRLLTRRVRSLRDLVDGAVFYGRTWNMASASAPYVEVPTLENVQFDKKDRLIITGRAKVRTTPDQPFTVEQSFKVRTKLGTRENGQYIRCLDPELALTVECPKAWERNIVGLCKQFDLPIPTRPEPLYTFFPLVSPLKKTDQDGFNLGSDNRIQSIFIKDNALRIQMSAIIRPGRYLDNNFLSFSVPVRTFIITMENVREGIQAARRNKRIVRVKRRLRERKKVEKKKRKLSFRYLRAIMLQENPYKRALWRIMFWMGLFHRFEKSRFFSSSSTTRTIVGGGGGGSGDVTLSNNVASGKYEYNDDEEEEEEDDEEDYEKDLSFVEPAGRTRRDVRSTEDEGAFATIKKDDTKNKPGFFSRFLEGYLEAAREETESERLTTAISEFFSTSSDDDTTDGNDDDDALVVNEETNEEQEKIIQ